MVFFLSDSEPPPHSPAPPGVAWLGWRDHGDEDDGIEDDEAIDEED